MSVRIIIISTLGVIVQLGLTILVWGDWNGFFSNPARTWLVIGSFLLLIAAWFSGSSGISAGENIPQRVRPYFMDSASFSCS